MEIRPNLTLNEICDAFPAALAILGDMGFDTCCGGFKEIGVAAAELNIAWDRVAEALTPVMKGA